MFIQTVIQSLLGKRKKARTTKSASEQVLSPMAQSIMQKLAEHEKNHPLDPKFAADKEKTGAKSDP